jgi:thiamine-phosphate pyrophosphorylase
MNRLLFISHQTKEYSYLESIEIALEGGCREIQLRMKDVSPDIVESSGKRAKELCKKYEARLYIDDHVEVCKSIGAAGVHLGKLDMPVRQARKILGDNFIIGGTANTFDDILELASAGADYIGLGPFRYTETKKNLSPLLGLSGYREIIKRCRTDNILLPVYAIGGITTDDISGILETGISGIALSSTILNAENPVEKTKEIINIINLHK